MSTCDSVQSVTFSPDGKNIAYTLNDNVIRIWDSMDCNGVIEHDFSLFCQLAMSNRGNVLALMVFIQNIHVINCRSESKSIFENSFRKNPFILITIVGSILLLLLGIIV